MLSWPRISGSSIRLSQRSAWSAAFPQVAPDSDLFLEVDSLFLPGRLNLLPGEPDSADTVD
jgi:hypothetical protein